MILIHQRCMKTQDHWDMWCNEPITLTACCFAAESLRRLLLALCFFLHTVLFFALNIFASWLDSSDRRSGCQTLNMLAKNQLSLSLSLLSCIQMVIPPNGIAFAGRSITNADATTTSTPSESFFITLSASSFPPKRRPTWKRKTSCALIEAVDF